MEIIYFFFIFIAIELFETNWQKSNTLYGLIYNNFLAYKKNIFIYFILHLSFFYSLYLAISLNNFGFFMSTIIVLKFLDISFKLTLMKKLSSGNNMEDIIPFNIAISPVLRYLNVLIYPILFLLSSSL
ncbi:hypothetical protein ACN2EN_09675 [Aliarcobacter lanthieri]|uniref:hypothetical protein n=2 Tax=Aliarcobacter lanthieri TaxID=1355374 RepID=UPI00047C0159|nr:hypothetical protein [Aliarcobacter lanthieri]QKF59895.1 putative membrane protein [Aliarcobacter lanthieri]